MEELPISDFNPLIEKHMLSAGSADGSSAKLAAGELIKFRGHSTLKARSILIRAGALTADEPSALPAAG